mmetsp:Transcript_6797/g.26531  ORF Transcript_6797/g.26531 Transcript_6797/m.26531 type:complete len:296 (+) Transcript_6797:4064-4951(+)
MEQDVVRARGFLRRGWMPLEPANSAVRRGFSAAARDEIFGAGRAGELLVPERVSQAVRRADAAERRAGDQGADHTMHVADGERARGQRQERLEEHVHDLHRRGQRRGTRRRATRLRDDREDNPRSVRAHHRDRRDDVHRLRQLPHRVHQLAHGARGGLPQRDCFFAVLRIEARGRQPREVGAWRYGRYGRYGRRRRRRQRRVQHPAGIARPPRLVQVPEETAGEGEGGDRLHGCGARPELLVPAPGGPVRAHLRREAGHTTKRARGPVRHTQVPRRPLLAGVLGQGLREHPDARV